MNSPIKGATTPAPAPASTASEQLQPPASTQQFANAYNNSIFEALKNNPEFAPYAKDITQIVDESEKLSQPSPGATYGYIRG